ncbi:DsrE family protein [Pelagibius marinus]|uniref:DsrE family protein n=1 Tax=Pelagibius marinus TaxID=2762760 RepID=UPI001872EC05|nr:DsrE family protein [Pelagibius marinus]
MPRLLFGLILGLVFGASLFAGQLVQSAPAFAAEQMHKVAVHVDESDPKRMNMALNNVQNVKQYYESQGQSVEIEVVAYGPGLHMLRADTSPVADRISAMALEIDGLTFSACGNTMKGMAKKEGKEVSLLSEARTVPSGVVRLVELQEEGYAYVRP